MASTLKLQTLEGPRSGPNANTVIIPNGHTLYLDGAVEIGANGSFVAPGTIKQIAYDTLGSTSAGQTTSLGTDVYYDSGLEIAITPTSANSSMLIDFKINLGAPYQVKARLVRDGSPIQVATSEGSRSVATSAVIHYDDNATTGNYIHSELSAHVVDEPETTDEVVYKVQVSAYYNNTFYINRGAAFQAGGTSGYDAIPLAMLRITEVDL